jgi:POT family proton-dependent oligopeptide transporter
LKGNISAQVGALYPPEDEARRTRGFIIFSTAINIGAVIGPLVCGLLAQVYGWHYGFGIAAIFMLLGLATYLYGYRYLPARVERRTFEGTRITAVEKRVVYSLIAVMLISIFESIAYGQVFNVSSIWIQQNVALDLAASASRCPGFNRSIRFSASWACRFCFGSGGNRRPAVASLTNWPRSVPAPFLPQRAT